MSTRIAAVTVAVTALATPLTALPSDAHHVWREVRNALGEPVAARRFAPAEQVGIDAPGPVARAASVIPADATYFVAVGPGAPLREPQSADFVKFWASFALLPRRRADALDQAEWIIAYGDALRTLPVRYGRVVQLGGGVRVAEVLR